MSSVKSNDNLNMNYIKHVVSQVMGEELWNGFYDVVTSERPRIDMYDDGKTIIVLSEASGILSQDDISISVSSNKLNIKILTSDKFKRNKPGKMLKSECIYGTFTRIIDLPYAVDEKNIKAIYENGLLEITMQKLTLENDKTIDVEFRK